MFDNIFQPLFDAFDNVVVANLGLKINALIVSITPLLEAFVLLYGVFLIWKTYFEANDFPIMDGIKFIAALGFVVTFALDGGWIFAVLYPFVTGLGNDILAGQPFFTASSASGALEGLLNGSNDTISKMAELINFEFSNGETYIPTVLIASQILMVFLGTFGFVTVATLYLLLTKIILAILMFVAPIFISFAFFPSTRNMFQQWTGQVYNYMLLSLLFPLTFGFFLEIGNEIRPTSFASVGIGQVLITFIMYILFVILAIKLADLAGALSGGSGINGLVRDAAQMTGAAKKLLSPATSAGKGALKGGGKLGVKGASAAYNYGKGKFKP